MHAHALVLTTSLHCVLCPCHRRNYFDATDALIYVIDSADRNRLLESGVELNAILEVGGCTALERACSAAGGQGKGMGSQPAWHHTRWV